MVDNGGAFSHWIASDWVDLIGGLISRDVEETYGHLLWDIGNIRHTQIPKFNEESWRKMDDMAGLGYQHILGEIQELFTSNR